MNAIAESEVFLMSPVFRKNCLSALAVVLCALLSSCQKTTDATLSGTAAQPLVPEQAEAPPPQPALSEAQAYRNILQYGFEPVAMTSATPAQIESARLWRSVASSVSADGTNDGQLLSLNPANEDLLPVIWHVAANRAIALNPPPANVGDGLQGFRVAELGAFSGGLAPARIEKTNAGSRPPSRWGYVDSEGNWLAAGLFDHATSFVGDVAIVMQSGEFKLIDRQGEFLNLAQPSPQSVRYGSASLERVGHWVRIGDILTDGATYQRMDNRVINGPSPDGLLWIVETEKGPTLWSVEQGLISLPDDLTPQRSLSATTFLGASRKTEGSAIYGLDGKVLADPAPIVGNATVLAENRFVACEGSYSEDAYKSGSIAQAPHYPRDWHCGIMDARGQWWAPPRYHVINVQPNQRVLLQIGDKACLADLSQATGPANCDQTGSHLPVPVLQSRAVPPDYLQYGYRDASGKLLLDYIYDQAMPFTGKVALASQGLPGLIDATGKWLTPQPSGPLSDVAWVRAKALTAQKRGTQAGYFGLIDRQGNWLIPPIYANLFRYPDGSLCARLPSRIHAIYTRCIHMDMTGKELPPLSDPEIEQFKAARAAPPAQKTPEVPLSVSATRPALEAVAVNGRWGFQNADGQWVIRPKFDDAADFSEGLGRVALRKAGDKSAQTVTPNQEEGETPQEPPLRWGVIDAKGQWVVKPRFDFIRAFRQGIAIAKDGDLGLLSAKGDWLPVPELSDSSDFANGVAQGVRKNGSLCRLTSDGKCRGAYDAKITHHTDDRFAVAQEIVRAPPQQGFFGYLGPDGEWAISPRFTNAQPFEGDYAIAAGEPPELPERLRQQLVTTEVRLLGTSGFVTVTVAYPHEQPSASRLQPKNYFDVASLPVSSLPMALATTQGQWLLPARSRSTTP